MTMQLRAALRNLVITPFGADLDGIYDGFLKIYSGSPPAAVTDAATGTLLLDGSVPVSPLTAPSGGSMSINNAGSWGGTAGGTGIAGYFRIIDSGGTGVVMQGTVTATGGGGDMTIDNTDIRPGQAVAVTTFTITAAGA